MAEIKYDDRDGSHQIVLPDALFHDGTTADLFVMPNGTGELFVDCSNCGTACASRVSASDLIALRNFLNAHVKG